MREVSLDARIVTSDGATGSLTNLIVDPSMWVLTHIVTDLQAGSRDFLVPIEYVSAASRPRVDLALTSHQILDLPEFTSTLVIAAGSTDRRSLPMLERRLPEGAIAFQRGARVLSFEQEYVGHLQSVLAGADRSISHLVVHLDSLSRVVILPIGAVQDEDNDWLRLRLARARLAKVPGVPDGDEGIRPVCDEPSAYDLVSVVFERPDAADDALAIVRRESGGGGVGRIEVAVLRKDASGGFTIHEQPDLTHGTGALGGAVAGALLGLVAGPVGVLAGAAAGGITGRALQRGVPDAYVQQLGHALASDSSAVVLLVQERFESVLLEKLAPLGGEVLRLALSDDMLDQLISWS